MTLNDDPVQPREHARAPVAEAVEPATAREDEPRFDAFLARLGERARSNVCRHLAACEHEPGHAENWKRLAAGLSALCQHSVNASGQRAVQFFAADGKYRRQIFALEDCRDGSLHLYLRDVVAEAVAGGLLAQPQGVAEAVADYPVREAPDHRLRVETLTAAKTVGAPAYYRHMLDWNRKAVRVSVPLDASRQQIEAVEALCAVAALGA